MKISVDDVLLFELNETQKRVIQNEINEDIFDEDMKRRLQYILTHKYEECFKRLVDQWMPHLKSMVSSVPTDDEALAELIFSHPEYKSRKERIKEEIDNKKAQEQANDLVINQPNK